MRMIDADALLKNIRRAVYPSDLTTTIAVGICQSHVKDMPTVDAELVVRCKRCKQWDNSSEGQYVGGWCFCDRLQMSTSPDWFCADGETKHEQTD